MSPFTTSAVAAFTVTAGRTAATTLALVALAGVVLGGLAVGRRPGRAWWPPAALSAGVAGLAGGAVVVLTADGGPGSGSGVVGGWAAAVLGLTAVLLGGLAARRA